MSTTDERRWKILDALYDSTEDTTNFIDIAGHSLGEPGGLTWMRSFQALESEGLVHYYGAGGGGSAAITDHGRQEVEFRRKHRSDPYEMRVAAQKGILQVLYGDDPNGVAWTDLQGDDGIRVNLAGNLLPAELIGRVADDMIEAGLIRGGKRVAEFPGPLTAQLTDLGRKCAESGRLVDEFLEQQQRNQPSQVFHFTGPASGNFNWGEHVTQNATTSSGIVADEVAQLVQAITAALPTLGLTDEQQAAVARDVQVIEGELQKQTPESPGIVKSMLRRTLDTIQQEGGTALGVYIVTTAKHVLANAGIDLG